MSEPIQLSLLTLNCWGIPYVSKNRATRMNAIAEQLVNEDYDIVCLQEIWSIDDFRMIQSSTRQKLPYSHYFFSGVVGSGVCILSRYCIEDVMFHKWPLNGYVHKIHHGDWFGGKGVGLCKIRVRCAIINVYVAHLHAEYSRENDEYTAHRILQAFDTAQFIRMTKGGTDAVILGGDLNTEPQDLAYRIICGVAGLTDACERNSPGLGTNECARNSYTDLTVAKAMPQGKRIDYILYLGSKEYKMEVCEFEHPFPERVPNANFSFSDHEAVMATFKLTRGKNEIGVIDVRESLKEAIKILENALITVKRQRIWYFIICCILIVPIIWTMGLEYATSSIGVTIALSFSRLFLTAIFCYSFFMSTLWSNVEQNSLKAGCAGMELQLMRLSYSFENNCNNR